MCADIVYYLNAYSRLECVANNRLCGTHTHTTRNAYLYYFTFINKLCFIASYNKRNETYRKFTFLHFLRITFVSGDGGSEIGRIACIRPNECDE